MGALRVPATVTYGISWPGARPDESFASLQFAAEAADPFVAGGEIVAVPLR